MITFDALGCILDNSSRDGGDSARANGVMALFDKENTWSLGMFVTPEGFGVRHPTMAPWNNPGNFTRDQVICLVAGMYGQDMDYLAYRVYLTHKKRFFFAQNIDRDYPVISRKYPWPHHYQELIGDKQVEDFSWFDYRDPIWSPDDIFHLATCAQIDLGRHLRPLSDWLLKKKIDSFSRSSVATEPNQLICKVKVAGPEVVSYFKQKVDNWKPRVDYYWKGWRNQEEIAEAIKEGF